MYHAHASLHALHLRHHSTHVHTSHALSAKALLTLHASHTLLTKALLPLHALLTKALLPLHATHSLLLVHAHDVSSTSFRLVVNRSVEATWLGSRSSEQIVQQATRLDDRSGSTGRNRRSSRGSVPEVEEVGLGCLRNNCCWPLLLLMLLWLRGGNRTSRGGLLGGRCRRSSSGSSTGIKPALSIVFVSDELFKSALGALLVDLLVGGKLGFIPERKVSLLNTLMKRKN